MTVNSMEIPESTVIERLKTLSSEGRKQALRTLVTDYDFLESMTVYGDRKIRDICSKRGIDWDSLSEEERERLVDEMKHESRRP